MYRSTDKEVMEKLKTNVLTVTKGTEKEDRKYALDYFRTHIRVDDLHRYALRHFPGKTLILGQGSYSPRVVVVTKNPISTTAKQLLETAWERMKIPTEDIYYTHLRFVATKKKQTIRQEILDKLIDTLRPMAVLTFDEINVETKVEPIIFPHPIKILTTSGSKDEKRLLTKKLKEVRQLISD